MYICIDKILIGILLTFSSIYNEQVRSLTMVTMVRLKFDLTVSSLVITWPQLELFNGKEQPWSDQSKLAVTGSPLQ